MKTEQNDRLARVLGWAGERKGRARRFIEKHALGAEKAAAAGDMDGARVHLDAVKIWSGRESAFAEMVRELAPKAGKGGAQ